MTKRKFTGLFIICILLIWLSMPVEGENTGNSTVLNPGKGLKGLVYAYPRPCTTLDPALARDDASALVISNIFEGLVRFSGDSTKIEPCLAQSWEISEDGLEWTFHLRRGVSFHDGTPFNARAVKFSIERQQKNNPDMVYSGFVYGPVKEIKIIDNYTIKFILKYPYTPFLNNLAMPFAAPVVSPDAVKKLGTGFERKPVGTGPFKLEKREDNIVVITRNPSYWGNAPGCEAITFLTVPSEERRIELLKKGQVHLASNMTSKKAQLLAQEGFKIHRITGLDISYLGFYVNKPPFCYLAARQAVNLGLDRINLVQETLNGQGVPAVSYLPPTLSGSTSPAPSPDIQKARELLETIPLKTKNITIITYSGSRPYNPAGGEILAKGIASQLSRIGLQVTVKPYKWKDYKKALARQEGDAFLYGWISDNADPDNFLYPSFASVHIKTGLNASHINNRELDTILLNAQSTPDQDLRRELYQKALALLENEVPRAVLNHSLKVTVTAPEISNYQIHPTGWDKLNKITIHN